MMASLRALASVVFDRAKHSVPLPASTFARSLIPEDLADSRFPDWAEEWARRTDERMRFDELPIERQHEIILDDLKARIHSIVRGFEQEMDRKILATEILASGDVERIEHLLAQEDDW